MHATLILMQAEGSVQAESMQSIPTVPAGEPPGSVPMAMQYSHANVNPLLSESIDARIAQWGERRAGAPVSQVQRLRSQGGGLYPASQGQRQVCCHVQNVFDSIACMFVDSMHCLT